MSAKRRLKRLACVLVVALYLTFSFPSDSGTGKPNVEAVPTQATNFFLGIRQNAMIVEPYHGLGNRLRAYASAAALARKTGRSLIVVWIPDQHVNATMSDLFDTADISVFDYPITGALSVFPQVLSYDYNAVGRKDEVLRDSTNLPIYVRSAYVLQSETFVSEADISEEIRALKPSDPVKWNIRKLEAKLSTVQGELIGVHIRMNTDIYRDVPGIQKIEPRSPASAARMGPVISERSRCHFTAFIPHMDEKLRNNPFATFFVASDTSCAIVSLISNFPGKILSTDLEQLAFCEGSDSRGKSCLQVCLAELLVLGGNVSSLILSEWSSASELIQRLSAFKIPHVIGCAPKRTIFSGLLG